jgi:hypothetical protein
MLLVFQRDEHPDRLVDRLHHARTITPGLISDVVARACERFSAHKSVGRTKIDRLIEHGAWTDAVIALTELELPQWKLRRLAYEDGEWLCSLSKQPHLPLGLDELAEARHHLMPLAIALALVEARRMAVASATKAITVPQVRPVSGQAICCDNFI